MPGIELQTFWRCREPGCDEHGEGTNAKLIDKAAAKHGKTTRHATTCWSEPPLPIKVKG